MILRFQIKDLQYNYVEDNLCDGALVVDYVDTNISISVDGEVIATSTNLDAGLVHAPVPFNTVANTIAIEDIQVESGTHVLIQMDLPNVWDKTIVSVNISKAGFNTLTRTFTVYGYDLGINAAVPATVNNDDVCFILAPTNRGVGNPSITINHGIGETVIVTAVNFGTAGNGFNIIGNGVDSYATLIANWNAANPTNLVIGSSPDAGLAAVPSALQGVFSITNGVDEIIDDRTYASFHGWRVPFNDDILLYHNNSALYDLIEYSDEVPTVVSSFRDAILCCDKGDTYKQLATIYDRSVHCGSPMIADTCETAYQMYPKKKFIPTYSLNVACNTGCCPTNGCVIVGDDNVIKPLADFDTINTINVNDVVVLPYDEVTMIMEVYDCTGVLVESSSTPIPLAIPIDISSIEVPFNPPIKGDYVIQVTYVVGDTTGGYSCIVNQTIIVCDPYTIEKLDCNKYKACIYKIGVGTEILKIGKLDKNKIFQPYLDFPIPYCGCVDIDLLEDGVYNFEFQGATTPTNLIVIVDCKWKACALAKISKLACTKKQDCACGGNCNSSCNSVPQDLYDLNAFAALSYGYFSLLNSEYLNNYIYAVLDPNTLNELHTIDQFLCRVEEYCTECNFEITKSNDCGCSK